MSMKIISVSLPAEVDKQISEIAALQNRSKSQIVAEAMKKYDFDLRWAPIQQYGQKIAEKLGIKTDDDVERIFGRKAPRSR